MGAQVGQLRTIITDWAGALRGLPQNPLPARWALADRRRLSGRGWFRANPGLFTLGIVLALIATTYFVVLLTRMAGIGEAYTAQLQARALLSMGTSALLVCGLLFTLCWLMSAAFRLGEFSLGFLSTHGGKHRRGWVDEETILTGLGPQEVLAAAAVHLLRIITPPLAVFSILLTGALAWLQSASDTGLLTGLSDNLVTGNPGADTAWWLASVLVRSFGHGLLAALIMGGFCIGLSLVRHPAWPASGAGFLVFMQLTWLGRGWVFVHHYVVMRPEATNGALLALCCGLLGIALLVLMIYIVLTNRVLRLKPWLTPIIFLLVGLAGFTGMTFLEESDWLLSFTHIYPILHWAGQALALADPFMLVPDQLAVNPAGAISATGKPDLFLEWWRVPLQALLQVLFLVVAAEFARQVVKLRLAGEEV